MPTLTAPILTTQRTKTLNTGRRSIELPVDSLGRERLRAKLDQRSIEKKDDGTNAVFKGHAAVFGSRTFIGPKAWGFWEEVDKGAFDKTIKEADVRFLQNHNPDLIIARNTSGTLDLAIDSTGLYSEADMDLRQSYSNDLAISLERGDTSQMSFAFEVVSEKWEELDDGSELRTLLELRLWDVSAVTYPAYEDTDAGLRGASFDLICREAGIGSEAQDRLMRALSGDRESIADVASILGSTIKDLDIRTEPGKTTQPESETKTEDGPEKTTRDAVEDGPEKTTRSLEMQKRKHSLNAARYGLK